jgi:hypothetical protein
LLFFKQQKPTHSPPLNQDKMSRFKLLCHKLPKLSIPLPPLQTFALFPELPKELRDEIWRLAALIPRDVKIWNIYHGGTSLRVSGQTQPPGIVQASNESRTESLKYYTRLEEKCPLWANHRGNIEFNKTFFVNFAADRFIYQDEWSWFAINDEIFNIDYGQLHLIKHWASHILMSESAPTSIYGIDPTFSHRRDFYTLLKLTNSQEFTFIVRNWAPSGEENTVLADSQRCDIITAITNHYLRDSWDGPIAPINLQLQWVINQEDDLSPCATGQKRFEEVGEALPPPAWGSSNSAAQS